MLGGLRVRGGLINYQGPGFSYEVSGVYEVNRTVSYTRRYFESPQNIR